ncbi:MAG: response regulator [Thermotogaceae bacterium]|nr:response regulator [Thermotogaceae bacterium]
MAKLVMIVEDSDVLRKISVFNLKKHGYSIIEAANGEEAIQKLSEGIKPDLMLLDIMMPKMDGFTVLKKLKENDEWKGIPVIVVTAKGGEDDEKTALSLGATKVMTKPFSPIQLIQEVKRVIGDA